MYRTLFARVMNGHDTCIHTTDMIRNKYPDITHAHLYKNDKKYKHDKKKPYIIHAYLNRHDKKYTYIIHTY